MSEQELVQRFEDQPICAAWDEEQEEWYFSIIDMIQVLIDQNDYNTARKYWNKLKQRLKDEGSQLVTNCHQLKLKSPKDGKRYATDVATIQQLFRIIQSVPSPKAEPIKVWLAQVGRERIEETIDPEQAIDRALETYQRKGYSPDWIHQRILAIRVRNELTAEWQARGVEQGREYAILTDEITRAWSDMTTKQYKQLKIKKEQYEQIKERFPKQRKPAKISNLDVLNAVLYVVENGWKWRSLPKEYGAWLYACCSAKEQS